MSLLSSVTDTPAPDYVAGKCTPAVLTGEQGVPCPVEPHLRGPICIRDLADWCTVREVEEGHLFPMSHRGSLKAGSIPTRCRRPCTNAHSLRLDGNLVVKDI